MVIDDFYLSIQYCLLNFNSPMYTDCKICDDLPAVIVNGISTRRCTRIERRRNWPYPFRSCGFQLMHVHGLQVAIEKQSVVPFVHFNSCMYTDCKMNTVKNNISSFVFQLMHVHGLQGAWNKSQTLSGPVLSLSRASCKRPILREYTEVLRTNHGELLDLFFARLLPSGTGDFGIGPSRLREKQTNPIMWLPYPLTGCFFSWITWTSPGRVLLPSVPFLSSWYSGVRRLANGCLRVRFRSLSLRP